MRFLFVLLLSSGLASARVSAQPISPDFSHYLQTEGFNPYLGGQTNQALRAQHILAISEFSHGGSRVLEYKLTDRGAQEFTHVSIPFGIGVGNWSRSLSETQLTALASAIRELPPTNALPPIDDLVLVSFRQRTNWITRSYDKRSLPKAMERIYDIRRGSWVRNYTVQ